MQEIHEGTSYKLVKTLSMGSICIKEHEILNLNSITIVTGPESGYSETEREIMHNLGLSPLKIGHYILRAETAPVVGLSKFHSLFGEN